MGTIIHLSKTIGLVTLLILSLCSCSNADMQVIAEGSTRVYKDYPDSGIPNQDKVIAILNQSETGDVIHQRYSKDFMFYKIRLKDGREGYVWFGDKFRVVPRTQEK